MNSILISFLVLLGSCSWSQAEFRKWAQKDDKAPDKQLEKVGANAEEVEKFKVEEIPADAAPESSAELTSPAAGATAPVPAPTATTKPKAPVKPAPTPVAKPVVSAKPAPVAPSKKPVAATSTSDSSKDFKYPADLPDDVKKLDERSSVAWSQFTPSFTANEVQFLDVDYLGMTVGKVSMRFKGIKIMNGKEVYHFQARFKTAPFYAAFYELDDTIDTYVDKKNFLGQRYNLIQRESKQSVDEVQLYDQEKLRTIAYQKQVRSDKTKNRHWEGWMPRYNIDSFSSIYLIRGLPLKVGENYAITIVNKSKLLVFDLKVEAKEKITTKKGEKNSIRVHAFTKYSGSTLKSGDMTFWLADTPGKELLRCKANIKIGAVYAEVADGD